MSKNIFLKKYPTNISIKFPKMSIKISNKYLKKAS